MSDAPITLPETIDSDEDIEKYISVMEAYFIKRRSQTVAIYDRHLLDLQDIRKNMLERSDTPTGTPKVVRPNKRGYYECSECRSPRYASMPHRCGDYPNNLFKEDLNEIHKEEGWEVIGMLDPDPPVDSKTGLPQETTLDNRPAQVEPAQIEPAQDKSVQPKPDPLFLPRAHSLRPGAKRDRAYQFLRELLAARGVDMHVDQILERIQLLDDFKGMKRTTLFNILSKLKSKGLLVSDNRGFWALR
jgi:hypothetical protein